MFWPLVAYFILVILLVTAILAASYILGQRHADRATGAPYESGIVSEGSARARLSTRYYLIAAFFVVFDLEAAFVFSWAVAARQSGWQGYWEVLIFIGILLATLIYLARIGGLNWADTRRTST